ncbi:PREDICTED: complex III assembly factor LYRM7 [Polistes dominula]|uniref:Complex III assembly factor LYRM7 n=1 Tax=Polistes dominula TaxID=743375 RepID=A0ABM1HV29_POLDO|nr:PREDICTED: complex III assembly factor LYRM7 [Polistes dominula]
MAEILRREILHQFKVLHRTRLNTFKGDENALKVIRAKINEEYRKNKDITNQDTIKELNKLAQEVEHELRFGVIQATEKEPGVYALRITPEKLLDNATCENVSSSNNSKSKLLNKKSVCGENIKKS